MALVVVEAIIEQASAHAFARPDHRERAPAVRHVQLAFSLVVLLLAGQARAAPSDFTSDLGRVPGLDARVTALRFFETGANPLPRGQWGFRTRFARGNARYVAWEIALEFTPPGRRIELPIDEAWYRADGRLIARQSAHLVIEPHWNQAQRFDSFGWRDPGHWPSGVYRVVLSVRGTRVASGSFTIFAAPREAVDAYNEGGDLNEAGSLRAAIAAYDRAIRYYPGFVEAYAHRCAIYGQLRDYERAVNDCNTALQLEPRHALAYSNRAATHHQRGQYEAAIADASRAIALDPNDTKPYVTRGLAHYALRDDPRALADLSQAQALGHRLGPEGLGKLDALRRRVGAGATPARPAGDER